MKCSLKNPFNCSIKVFVLNHFPPSTYHPSLLCVLILPSLISKVLLWEPIKRGLIAQFTVLHLSTENITARMIDIL